MESTARLTYQKVNDILEAKQSVLEVIETGTSFQRPDQLAEIGVLEKKQIKGRHYYRNRELEEVLSY